MQTSAVCNRVNKHDVLHTIDYTLYESSFSLSLKHLLCYTETAICKLSASASTLALFLPQKMFHEKIHHDILSCP